MTMNASAWVRLLLTGSVISLVAVAATPARAEVLEKSRKVARVTVQYKVVLPDGYDPARTYPASSRSAAVRRR